MARLLLDFGISPGKVRELASFAERLGVSDDDLEETFIRSGGHGGQNVNKVSTCVVLTYLPTGLTVRVQKERTQLLNRFLARRQLLTRLEEERHGRASAIEQEREKIRRQKRKRSKRAKAKMLDNKSHHGAKKASRRRPGMDE